MEPVKKAGEGRSGRIKSVGQGTKPEANPLPLSWLPAKSQHSRLNVSAKSSANHNAVSLRFHAHTPRRVVPGHSIGTNFDSRQYSTIPGFGMNRAILILFLTIDPPPHLRNPRGTIHQVFRQSRYRFHRHHPAQNLPLKPLLQCKLHRMWDSFRYHQFH